MSDEKNLPATRGENSPQLHDNGLKAGSLIQQSLSRLTKEQAESLAMKAAEAGLDLEVKKLQQDADYQMGRKAAEDHIDTFNMLEKRGRTTRQTVRSDIKTGAGKMNIESKSGASCFVASVAYQNPNHSDVVFLRKFRDVRLAKYHLGRTFIEWYWRNGPKLARVVQKSEALRLSSRFVISRIVAILRAVTALD
ncbi:CFI-box-CTERM domain-containing protein [Methylocystis sp. JAN1]|uniref:CFI-box-CTERM domain-containing protein n=1 Tax=Methylocystis sp. JAN1 TaxID=3397211 RepID=UPI003FA25E5A